LTLLPPFPNNIDDFCKAATVELTISSHNAFIGILFNTLIGTQINRMRAPRKHGLCGSLPNT